MNCNKYQLKLSNLVDNELAEKDLKLIEEHLTQCVSCQQKLTKLKQIKLQVNNLVAPAISPGFEEQLQQKIQQLNQPKRSYIPWAAAATIIIMLSTTTLKNQDSVTLSHQELLVELQTAGKPTLSENEFVQWTQVELDSNFRCSNASQSGLCN